jgi:hemerythrin superfamily protein
VPARAHFKETNMTTTIAFEDAIDLLDADHKAVKQMFVDYHWLSENKAPPEQRQALVEKICNALTVHSQIEEEIFYPKVREAIDDDELMDEAADEHAEAKDLIARLEKMSPADAEYDATVTQLGELIDQHVLEEREEMFLQARQAAIDLRALAVPLWERSQQLKEAA